MGALNYKTRRNRRHRLAAELYATWTPRRLFTFGTSVGWAHWFTDPNLLYRRRNRLTYTRDFSNAAWTRTNILSVTSDADGVGDLVVPNTTPSTHAINQQSAVTVGATTTYVVRAKPGGYNFVILSLGGSSLAYFDVSAGTVGTTSNAISTSIAAAADAPGYYDCTLVAIPTSANCFIYAAQTNGVASFAGDGTSGVYLARAQLETYTTTPTEYQDVPTTWPQAYLDAVGAENIYAWVDKAGTTPVTAVGDTIGLSLDRAYGGARGVELVTNGDFASDTWWTKGTDWVISGGVASRGVSASFSNLSRPALLTVGKTYQIQLDIVAISGTVTVLCGGGSSISFTTTGRKSTILTCSGDAAFYIQATGGAVTCTIDNVSIREIPGTHRIQASAPSRPLLMARVNLLTHTEFAGAVAGTPGTAPTNWAFLFSSGTTAVPSAGTLTLSAAAGARHFINPSAGVVIPANATYTFTVDIVAVSGNAADSIVGVQATAGSIVGTPSILVSAGTGRKSMSVTAGAGGATILVRVGAGVYGNAFADTSITFRQPDFRTADDAAKNIPAYQRVGATAADHDTDGFPHYLLYDGTDDSMASAATVDGSATDKVTVVTGVTKNSDAATAVCFELTSSIASNSGAIAMFTPGASATPNTLFRSKGTVQADATGAGLAAPVTYTATGSADIGTDAVSLRVNGVLAASAATDQGTGNYSNALMYWGSRSGASLRFNGREYASIGRFGPMSDTERNRLESWVKNLMRLP